MNNNTLRDGGSTATHSKAIMGGWTGMDPTYKAGHQWIGLDGLDGSLDGVLIGPDPNPLEKMSQRSK